MIKKTYSIRDMHCSSCAMRIEGIEDDLPGIQEISASYQKQEMRIIYNEMQVTEEKIIASVERLGYHVVANK